MNSKHRITQWLALLALSAFNSQLSTARAQGTTAFTYQGQLRDTGTNANGTYAMTFKLYDAVSGGSQIGDPLIDSPSLANGLFTVNLDFGAGAFNGSARWLDITVQAGTNAPESLAPRVQVSPSPYSLYSGSAGSAARAGFATNLAGGTWNASVGNYQSYSNCMLFTANGSLVFGMSPTGGQFNGGLGVVGSLGVQGDLSSSGNVNAGGSMNCASLNTSGNMNCSNITASGSTYANGGFFSTGPFGVWGPAGQSISMDDEGMTIDVVNNHGPPHAIGIQTPAAAGVPNPGLVRIENLSVGGIYGDVFLRGGSLGCDQGMIVTSNFQVNGTATIQSLSVNNGATVAGLVCYGATVAGGALKVNGGGAEITGNISCEGVNMTGNLNLSGNLQVSGQKNFVQTHPTDSTKEIVYTCLEGPESGTYLRGSADVVNGEAVIALPDHFGMVTSTNGLTVQLTPRGTWLQLYVSAVGTDKVAVREAEGRSGRFDYLVQGVRLGYEKSPVIRERQSR